MTEIENIEHYRYQISLARTEIKNLRQQISSLKHEHQNEIKQIKSSLNSLRCANCGEAATTSVKNGVDQPTTSVTSEESIKYSPIGVIESSFQNKRGVPRQATILDQASGTVVIRPSVFNNPEHALSGLEEFSHMWIIFHFHATESSKSPAKVSPPRLAGERKGVLSTRSPHRPCPIGLSLVKIHSIEGNKIHFQGVDMINGTPVLDIKPYILQYDYPEVTFDAADISLNRPRTEGVSGTALTIATLQLSDTTFDPDRLNPPQPYASGVRPSSPFPQSPYDADIPSPLTDDLITAVTPPDSPSTAELVESYITGPVRRLDNERGAPDGQERFTPPQSASVASLSQDGIRVAPWISNPPAQRFDVHFTDDAIARLRDLIGDRAEVFKSNIERLLAEDPRSTYVRNRYPNHEYSCVLEDVSISCVFNADTSTCTIIAVRSADDLERQNN